jgi:SAM-dependent methyltransferase
MERHRHLWLFLGERTDLLARPQRLLHFAPEAVFREQLRARHGLGYVTADLKASRGDVRADITRIPFAEGSFDAVLCNHVFEHVPDDVAAMGQIRRVLRPGGWAVLQVPLRSRLAVTQEDPGVTDPRDRERLYGQHDHLRQYGRDYEERLQMAGFLVEAERFGDTLPVERQQRHGLKSETIYLCRRATER